MHALAAISVAAVAGTTFASQVVIHLGIQRPLCQRFFQPIQQTALVKGHTLLRA
jgi:hypothetical protein